MLVFPERVLDGDIANRDFLHLYGPGSLWALAGTYSVFGTSIEVERLFGLAQHVALVAAVFTLGSSWGRALALACALISLLVILPATGLTALAWVGAVALGLLALSALLEARQRDARSANLFAWVAGLLAGASLLFRADLFLAVALCALVVGVGATRAVRGRALTGLLIGLSPYFVHIATAGAGNVFEGMIVDPVLNLRGGRRLPLPPNPGRFDGFLQRAADLDAPSWPGPSLSNPAQLTAWFFVLLCATTALLVVGWLLWRRWAPGSHRGLALFAVALFGVGILPQAIQRVDSTHFAAASCVPLAFLPIAAFEVMRHRAPHFSRRRLATTASALGFAVVLLAIPRFTIAEYADDVRHTFVTDPAVSDLEHEGRNFPLGRADVAEQLAPLLNTLSDISRSGDTVLVGSADLRFTPYSDAYLYHLLPDLEPATFYIEMDPGIANAPDSGLADEVRNADFLILSSVWENWDEPNDSRNPGSEEPDQVVEELFCEVDDFGPLFRLLTRCDRS